MAEKKAPPLSTMLREKASAIEKLLKEYEVLRHGDETWRYGDEQWRKGIVETHKVCDECGAHYPNVDAVKNCKCGGNLRLEQVRLGTPPQVAGTPPQITVISSPRNIYYEEEEDEEEIVKEAGDTPSKQNGQKTEHSSKVAFNPLSQAAVMLGEITLEDAHKMELEKRYNILADLDVDERRNCNALVPWLRKLAGNLTYILETREIYSAEIKAVYPELLANLEIAIGTCDQLAHLLGRQSGALTRHQYDELLIKLLHYTEIARQAALQLADHHEEFLGVEVSPLEPTPEVTWVLEEEEKKIPRKELEEEETKEQKGE